MKLVLAISTTKLFLAEISHGDYNFQMNTKEDGYTIVDTFLASNPYIVGKIEAASVSPFTGDFIHFYGYYYGVYGTQPISTQMINLVKSLRNGCAHNNCIIADLNSGTSRAPADINRMVNLIPEIKQNQKKKKLSCRSILEFVCMLYVYDDVVSEKVKRNRIIELKALFKDRIPEKSTFFKKNELICSSYRFVNCIIDYLFG